MSAARGWVLGPHPRPSRVGSPHPPSAAPTVRGTWCPLVPPSYRYEERCGWPSVSRCWTQPKAEKKACLRARQSVIRRAERLERIGRSWVSGSTLHRSQWTQSLLAERSNTSNHSCPSAATTRQANNPTERIDITALPNKEDQRTRRGEGWPGMMGTPLLQGSSASPHRLVEVLSNSQFGVAK